MKKNLTHATYERLCQRAESSTPQSSMDVADLLEAYENACLLLDKALETSFARVENEVSEFLYTDNGDPRVNLWENE